MAIMMLMTARSDVMGAFTIGRRLKMAGWIATGLMTFPVAAMFATMI